MKFTEAMTKLADGYADQLNKMLESGSDALSHVSPGELGWGAVGAGGGAMMGYALSRLLHRKPSKRVKLLYSLLGAAAGGAGSQYLLANMPGSEGFNGSKRDEMRLIADNPGPDPIKDEHLPVVGDGNYLPWKPRTSALAAALVGAYRGSRLGANAGGLLNPNVYETVRHSMRRDLNTLQSNLRSRPSLSTMAQRRAWLSAVGNRFGGYDATLDSAGQIKLTDSGHDVARGASNAAAAALLHAAAAYGAHKGVNALVDRFSQNIDAGNAGASKEKLLRSMAGA